GVRAGFGIEGVALVVVELALDVILVDAGEHGGQVKAAAGNDLLKDSLCTHAMVPPSIVSLSSAAMRSLRVWMVWFGSARPVTVRLSALVMRTFSPERAGRDWEPVAVIWVGDSTSYTIVTGFSASHALNS